MRQDPHIGGLALLAPILALFASPAAAARGPVESGTQHGELDAVALLQTAQQSRIEEEEGLRRKKGRVLVFWSVGSKARAMELVKQNVAILREEVEKTRHSKRPIRVDVFLAHYDRQQKAWTQTEEDQRWYHENVQFWAQDAGYKMKLANIYLLKKGLRNGVDIDRYEWLWLLDEDADFSKNTSLATLVEEARASNALIVGPSVILPPEPESSPESSRSPVSMDRQKDSWYQGCQPGMPMCKLATPDHSCRYRYTNFVEVMFTFIKPDALRAALTRCPDCLHSHSVWGLDKTWCALTADALKRDNKTACAIVDRVSVIHENLKTLDKWQGPADRMSPTGNNDVLKEYHADMGNTRLLHAKHFQMEPRMLKCVKETHDVQ